MVKWFTMAKLACPNFTQVVYKQQCEATCAILVTKVIVLVNLYPPPPFTPMINIYKSVFLESYIVL